MAIRMSNCLVHGSLVHRRTFSSLGPTLLSLSLSLALASSFLSTLLNLLWRLSNIGDFTMVKNAWHRVRREKCFWLEYKQNQVLSNWVSEAKGKEREREREREKPPACKWRLSSCFMWCISDELFLSPVVCLSLCASLLRVALTLEKGKSLAIASGVTLHLRLSPSHSLALRPCPNLANG